MRLDSEDKQIWIVGAVWAAALVLGAFAILIPAAHWMWSAPHILTVFVALILAEKCRVLPGKSAAVGLFAVWMLSVVWSVCYLTGLAHYGFAGH